MRPERKKAGIEDQELRSHAKPITSDELHEGKIYFFVQFADDALLVPMMETVVYIGRNLEAGDENTVYFQDVQSYLRGVRYDSATGDDNALFQCGPQDQLGHVFDYEQGINELLACLMRRRAAAAE